MSSQDEKQAPSTIDRHYFVPHYLGVLSNSLIWSQSRFFLETYGSGINEVRIVSVLAHDPGLTAKQLCDALAMNKSIVSRTLVELQEKKLVHSDDEGRRKAFVLTESGLALNTKIVEVSLDRERRLLRGFSEHDKVILLGYLARMLKNLEP